MGIYQRIIEIVKIKTNGSIAKLEAECGIGSGLIKKQGDDVTLKTLDKILRIYSDINREWLVHGKGEMLISNIKNSIPPPDVGTIGFESVKIFAHLELRITELKDEVKWLKRQIELKDEEIRHFLNRGGEVIQPDLRGTSRKEQGGS